MLQYRALLGMAVLVGWGWLVSGQTAPGYAQEKDKPAPLKPTASKRMGLEDQKPTNVASGTGVAGKATEGQLQPARVLLLERLWTPRAHVPPGVELRHEVWLDRIEYFVTGTARWHFTLRNQDRQKVVRTLFRKDSLMTDENGEKYPLGAVSMGWEKTREGDELTNLPTDAGEKQSFWLEFPTPKNGAALFTLRLASDPRLPPLLLHLPHKSLPEKLLPGSVVPERVDAVAKTVTPAKNAKTLASMAKNAFGNQVPYLVQFDKWETLANGDVRLHLTTWNKGNEKVRDTLLFEVGDRKSGLLDERGRGYLLVGSSLGTDGWTGHIMIDGEPGEKKSFWLEFRGPFKGGKRFTLRLHSEMGLVVHCS